MYEKISNVKLNKIDMNYNNNNIKRDYMLRCYNL